MRDNPSRVSLRKQRAVGGQSRQPKLNLVKHNTAEYMRALEYYSLNVLQPTHFAHFETPI